jgi:hypothetical protein
MVHMRLSRVIEPEDHPSGDLTRPSLMSVVVLQMSSTPSAASFMFYA